MATGGGYSSAMLPTASAEQREYDVIVGLPSLNEEANISSVTKAVDDGCQKFFPGRRCLIVNADCKSVDKTRERFLETETKCDKEYMSTSVTAEGKGAGLRLVFERMVQARATWGMCMDTDLETFTMNWVGAFAEALQQGADMVCPRYQRHRCDGTITNLITFPCVCALFARSVRQPIGGDFGFSLRSAKAYLEPEWTPMVKKYGIDIFMTTTVLKKEYKLVEVELPAKIHAPSLPKLAVMVEQVLSALLVQAKACAPMIRERLDSNLEKPPLVRWSGGGDMSIPEIKTDPKVLQGKAREVYEAHKEVLVKAMPEDIVPDVAAAVEVGTLDAARWAKLLFWGIARYIDGDTEAQATTVRCLQFGYLLRAASHIMRVQDMTNEDSEEIVSEQANLCMQQRKVLKDRPSKYDVVVGLPSYNEEASIGRVVTMVDLGCQHYFPGKSCLLVHVDGHSTDATKARFLETETNADKEQYLTATSGGKGAALRRVFERMVEVNAPVCFCVDTDIESISPEWVRSFSQALNQGADLACPRYLRHRCDGTITNLATFPLTCALFGRSVRQPMGGDFAVTLKAVKAFLELEWSASDMRYGVDILLTTTAIKQNLKLVEVELPPKVHAPSLPKLVPMVKQVLRTMLEQVKSGMDLVESRLSESVEKPQFLQWTGALDSSIPELYVDPQVLHGKARAYFQTHGDALVKVLPSDIVPDLQAAVEAGKLQPLPWAKLLFWGIGKYCEGDVEAQQQTIQCLVLCYMLRAVTHLSQVVNMTNEEAEDVVRQQVNVFLEHRASLRPQARQYDVVVGLPSLNEEAGISRVATVVDLGCQLYFPGKRCLIVNADCKSVDNTRARFLETETKCDKEYHSTEITAEGKGAGLRLMFERMVKAQAPYGICVDTDLETITPEWVRAFSEALLQGADMVCPRYGRHRCDGTITNLVTFPVVSSLFARSIRQPIGGDFGFSLRAAQAFLEPEWTPMTKKYGIDIFMTTTALKKEFKMMEVELPAKIHAPSLPKLVGMVEQVVSSLLVQVKSCRPMLVSRLEAPIERVQLVKWSGGGDMSIPEIYADPQVLHEKARQVFKGHVEELVRDFPVDIIPDITTVVEEGRIDACTWSNLLFWGIARYCSASPEEQTATIRVLQLGYLLRAVSHLSTVVNITNEEAELIVEAQVQHCVNRREMLKEQFAKL
eukprot:TRINITY_DN17721_c0_g1_i1.p1 TRINITY_DN17721_c0_g1~~TRINITY_DN17721_c0_g1_i1.p1  ORF type:complete len:1180 (+),score=273.34 TRINITY_DN17721_c0_g1_i1:88-3627(+)